MKEEIEIKTDGIVRGDKELRDRIAREGFHNSVKKHFQQLFNKKKKKNSKADNKKQNGKENGADKEMLTIKIGELLIENVIKALGAIAANIIIKHVFYTKKGQLYLGIKIKSTICKLADITVHYGNGEFITKMETGLGKKYIWGNSSIFDIPSTVVMVIDSIWAKMNTKFKPSKDVLKKKRKKKIAKKAVKTGVVRIRIGKVQASA